MNKKEVFSSSGGFAVFMLNSVLQMYRNGITNLAQEPNWANMRVGTNGHCYEAVAGYILLINVWESAINYVFIDSPFLRGYREPLLQYMEPDSKQWSIERKTHLFPLVMFGKTFNQSVQPYQDFKKLLSLRNSLTHHQQSNWPIKVVKDLASKGKTLPVDKGADLGWPLQICSLEGFRWGINTIIKMLLTLSSILPPDDHSISPALLKIYYLSDEKVRQLFMDAGLDPDYQFPMPFHYPTGIHEL